MAVKLVLSRKNEFMNRTRSLRVLIDGADVGRIANGKTEEFEMVPGKHTIECKIDWCKSNFFEINATGNEIIYLRVKSGLKYFVPLYVIFLLWLASGIFFKNKKELLGAAFPVVNWIIVGVPLLYMIYYFTLGKNKFLTIDLDQTNVFAK